MPFIPYKPKRFGADSASIIRQANTILEDYAQQGFDLTLRQLYYQFVSRDLLPNNDRSYKRLGSIVNDGRMAGLIDWDHIVDRTRNLRALRHWDDAGDMAHWASQQFRTELWEKQPFRVEVWIEKDALVGVIEGVCQEYDVPFFSCRGYTSQSEMWGASQRILGYLEAGQRVTILHLGDHDPSGIDMTRDIDDRLQEFCRQDAVRARFDAEGLWERQDDDDVRSIALEESRKVADYLTVDRIALTMAQIEETGAPPNPAKLTDARARGYIRNYGHESWELDALSPGYLDNLIRGNIQDLIAQGQWDADVAELRRQKRILAAVSEVWEQLPEMLGIEEA